MVLFLIKIINGVCGVICDISAICCSSWFFGEVGVLNNTNIFFCSLCVCFFSVISVVKLVLMVGDGF